MSEPVPTDDANASPPPAPEPRHPNCRTCRYADKTPNEYGDVWCNLPVSDRQWPDMEWRGLHKPLGAWPVDTAPACPAHDPAPTTPAVVEE